MSTYLSVLVQYLPTIHMIYTTDQSADSRRLSEPDRRSVPTILTRRMYNVQPIKKNSYVG